MSDGGKCRITNKRLIRGYNDLSNFNCRGSELMLNLCQSSTSESELLSKLNRIEMEVRRGRGWLDELSLSRS